MRSASCRTAVFNPDSEKFGSLASEHRPGKGKARRVAVCRRAFHLRSARVGQAEQLCDLVERLADRVVDGGAEPHIIADAEHGDDLRVPARGEEQAVGKVERRDKARRQRMRFEMIDRDKRRAMHQRDRLRRRQPDDDAADQARAGRGRDAAERRIADPGLLHRRFDDAVEQVDMGARGDLRHHAADTARGP